MNSSTTLEQPAPAPILSKDGLEGRMVIRSTKGNCGDDAPHIFESRNLPPSENFRCKCGKTTWKAAVKDAAENFAAVQSEREGARVPKATPDVSGAHGLETVRSADSLNPSNSRLCDTGNKE